MESYKYFLVYALLVLIAGLILLVFRWPLGVHKTFSEHAAAQKGTVYYYIGLFLVVLTLLYLFFWKYFVPLVQPPGAFLYLVAGSSLAQIGVTLAPQTGGLQTKIHMTFAGISALLLQGILVCLLAIPAITGIDRYILIVCTFGMAAIVAALVILKKPPLPALVTQALYFSLFFVAILFATY